MYRIEKQFEFSASHQLSHLPDGHKCKRLHGHNYVVTLVLEEDGLNKDSFVVDYGELAPVKKWIDETLDHRHLNDIHPFDDPDYPPTAERMAYWIYYYWLNDFPALAEVIVSETPKTKASYRR